MRVVLRPSARRDLRGIGDLIARDNPTRAVSFVQELEAKAASLADMPRRYSVAYQSSRGPVHRFNHGRYLMFYRVLRDRVEVLRFQHSARQSVGLDA